MSQYVAGTVAVTNASAAIVGTNTLWAANAAAGDVFSVSGSGVPYIIGVVTDDTHITLSSNYAGDTASGQPYMITTSFTPLHSIPYPEDHDIDTSTILKRAMLLIDTLFAGSATQNFAAKKLTLNAGALIESEGAPITAASSTNIWVGDGNTVHVTGNTGIADFGTAPQNGAWMKVIFDGTPLLTQSTNLNLNAGGANIQIAAGDYALVYADTTTQMDVIVIRKSGFGTVLSVFSNALSSDVALNNTANYFDGPSVAQGTSGKWFVSGGVTINDSTGAASFHFKLWDGTTVIDSRVTNTSGPNSRLSCSLSGYIDTPAGNLRISVKDTGYTSGSILYNNTGTGKDSTITAIRVG